MTTDSQPIRWEKVYIFISSTFGDMHAERDYLVKRVFPELQDWCERRRLRLVDIDLRWGVTEADTTSKRAVEVCLKRINDCRPFFLCFLGQRHGWVPKAAEISESTFTKFPALLEALQSNASVTELEIRHAILKPFTSTDLDPKHAQPETAKHAFFYFRDPGYLNDLRAAPRQLLCTFTDEAGLEDETDDERQQRERARKALQTLRKETIPQDKPVIYQADWRAELQTPELAMPLECTDEWRRKWNRFVHLNLADTDERIPVEKLTAANEYNAALTRGRLSQFRSLAAARAQFPPDTELAEIIQHDLREAIKARFDKHTEIIQETEQQKELDQQEGFLQACSEGFIERTGDFAQLDGYVTDDSNKLCVLTAAGGMGKSTLLAKWIDRTRTQMKAQPSLHFRFIGASDRSTTVYSLLRSLLGEMLAAKTLDLEIPPDPNKLREALPELLTAIGKSGKTVIVLDALNQLESGLQDLHWLPRTLPENIKLIVSFKRDDDASEQVYQHFQAAQATLIEVPPFAELEDRRKLVKAYLQQYLKELDEAHLATLIATAGASNPLYLKVVLSELRVFGAFAGLAKKIHDDFGDNPISAFQGVLQRLASDPAYAPIASQRAVPLLFGLLAHARHGLSVEELTSLFVQALGLEDNEQGRQAAADTINLLLRQVRPFLARREGRYDFFYESFKIAAQQCYVTEQTEEALPKRIAQQWHLLLANYFEGLPTWQKEPTSSRAKTDGQPTRRKVAELPYHLTQAEQWSRLEETLCDLGFIEAKCTAGMTYELVEEYVWPEVGMPERMTNNTTARLREMFNFIRAESHVLHEYPGLVIQQAANQPDQSLPEVQARQRLGMGEARRWCQLLNKAQSLAPTPQLTLNHGESVIRCYISHDGSRIASLMEFKKMICWAL